MRYQRRRRRRRGRRRRRRRRRRLTLITNRSDWLPPAYQSTPAWPPKILIETTPFSFSLHSAGYRAIISEKNPHLKRIGQESRNPPPPSPSHLSYPLPEGFLVAAAGCSAQILGIVAGINAECQFHVVRGDCNALRRGPEMISGFLWLRNRDSIPSSAASWNLSDLFQNPEGSSGLLRRETNKQTDGEVVQTGRESQWILQKHPEESSKQETRPASHKQRINNNNNNNNKNHWERIERSAKETNENKHTNYDMQMSKRSLMARSMLMNPSIAPQFAGERLH